MIFWLFASILLLLSLFALIMTTRRIAVRSWQMIAIVIIPFLSIGFYIWQGRPDLLSSPSIKDDAFAGSDLSNLVSRLEKEMINRPDDERGWRLLARSAPLIGRNDLALAALEALVALNPDAVDDWIALGSAHVHNDEGYVSEKASRAFSKALAHDSNRPEALWFLGQEAHQKQDFDQAVQFWRHLSTLIDSSHPVWDTLNEQLTRLESDDPPIASEK